MICFNNRTARRGVPQRAVKMHRRLSLPSVFLVAALIGSVGNAHAIECQSEKGAGYPWAWRLIDGNLERVIARADDAEARAAMHAS